MECDMALSSPAIGDATRASQLAFRRLPDHIIQTILISCEPDTFASLILLDRTWRRVSQQAHIYAHQLSRCRSYAASHPALALPVPDDDLPKLRRLFAHEVKRNLYGAYLRPQETLIKLVSTSSSSSAAFPGGEAFHFAFSPNGQYILAYSTSRIHVLHVADSELSVERELKILRRPASIAILNDGSRLAVLSTDHQVDLYDLSGIKPRHIRAIALDHHPRTISLSPCGSVLAAAYDGGIEVYSLRERALATDKRGVKSDAADHLSFSRDGMQLLGTTTHSRTPSSMVLSAPYFDPGEHAPEDTISQLWTTSILFPNTSRQYSHAALLPNLGDYEVNWAFTFDRVYETYRAVRTDDLKNGTTYFTGPLAPSASKMLPSTLPTSTMAGDLVASGFQGSEIWCYGVPESLDAPRDVLQSSPSLLEADLHLNPARSTLSGEPSIGVSLRGSQSWPRESSTRVPKWKVLCGKAHNAFVKGHKVSTLDGITGLKWIETSPRSACERLIATAPGGVSQPSGMSNEIDEDGMGAMDGGRLLLLDFRYSIMNGQRRVITIEVGEKEPDVLEEEHRDLETEVALVRSRTVAQNRAYQQTINRSATGGSRHPSVPSRRNIPVPPLPRIPSTRKVALASMEERSETSSIVSVDEQEALDAPYAHGAPRSGTTLRRAATAAASNRTFRPAQRGIPEVPRMRAADGRGELPHESDADNWTPPPPAYHDVLRNDDRVRRAVAPLSEQLRDAVLAGVLPSPTALRRSSTHRSNASGDSDVLMSLQRTRSTFSAISRSPPVSPPFTTVRPASVHSDVSAASDPGPGTNGEVADTTPTLPYDIYGVSPPRTPPRGVSPPRDPPVISPMSHPFPPPHHSPGRDVARSAPAPLPDTVPEIPVVNIQTAQTISPRPRHAALSTAILNINTASGHWNGPPSDHSSATRNPTRRLSSGLTLTQARLDADMPPRPNDDHRITDLPPVSPVQPMPSYGPPSHTEQPSMPAEDPVPPSTANSGHAEFSGDFSLPSASQLTRLNSRNGRPNSRMLDPARRNSGQFNQSSTDPNGYAQLPPPPPPQQQRVPPQLPPRSAGGAPRGAAGAYVAPAPLYPSYHDMQNSFAGQLRQRGMSDSTVADSIRPNMSRLETIHSVGSNFDAATQLANSVRPTIVGVSRQTSRAERSAAINIQEAKRRGWRGTTKKKKAKKDKDGASSAGWTDVSKEYDDGANTKQKKEGKCKVM